MIAPLLAPWAAIAVGTSTFGVCLWLHVRHTPEQDASGLALLAGCCVLLIFQSLEIIR